MKLVLSIGKITGGVVGPDMTLNPAEHYFDDSLFFEVEESDDDEEAHDGRRESAGFKYTYPVLKGAEHRTYNNSGYDDTTEKWQMEEKE